MKKQKKLGIVAGGGSIPQMLIEDCIQNNRDFFVLAIEGNADKKYFDKCIPHKWIRIGQAGTGFKVFKDNGVEEVVLIGTIRRPSFGDLIPDARTTVFFSKIAAKSLGDDGILRALVKEIEKDGMEVKGIHEVMDGLLVREGYLTKKKPDKQALLDIERGVEVARELGKLDVGQAVVVQQGLVLAVEGIEGTDELIKRCKNYKRKGDGGVLVKLRKPKQDMRVDLPTIGPDTIKNAKESGLRGIAIHAGNALIVDEKETIKLAEKAGMFIIGIHSNGN